MELAAYLGTVTATVTLALGSMWVVASVLGRRIDDLGSAQSARMEDMGTSLSARMEDMGTSLSARMEDMGTSLSARIDELGSTLGARIDRLESQNDAILGAVGDLGQRVAHLEARGS